MILPDSNLIDYDEENIHTWSEGILFFHVELHKRRVLPNAMKKTLAFSIWKWFSTFTNIIRTRQEHN